MKPNPKYGVANKKEPYFIKLNFKLFPSREGQKLFRF